MTQNLSNTTLNILKSQYFDDYDENKQFYRILFRPEYAVQARELTQLQTILQKQIQRHGDHIFVNGSVVDGCIPTHYSPIPFVRLKDSFLTNINNISDIESISNSNYLITNTLDSNTAVRAQIFYSKSGFEATYPNTNILYIKYLSTGKSNTNTDLNLFDTNQTLYIYNNNQAVLGPLSNNNLIASINTFSTNSTANIVTGMGYLVSVGNGTIYQKGFFLNADKQTVVVNPYLPIANSQLIGYETSETIINENQDQTLLDNALGSTNEKAPGAHRLKLTPVLTIKERSDTTTSDFFPVVEFQGNTVVSINVDPTYAAIGDVFSTRTYEQAGDFIIKPYQVITSSNTTNSSLFDYQILPGTSYVKGNRIEIIGSKYITTTRANTTQIIQNKAFSANYGPFVYCQEVVGASSFDKLSEVLLYDSPQNAISNHLGSSRAAIGNNIGKANIKSVVFYNGTKNHANCQYYVYIFNIRMNSGKSFSNDVKSIYQSAATSGYTAFKADLILENNLAIINDQQLSSLVYDTGLSAIKSLTPTGQSLDVSFIYRKTSSGTLLANGVVTYSLSGGLSSGGSDQVFDTKASNYQLILSSNAYTANLSGTVTTNTALSNSSTCNLIGTSTTFQSQLSIGDTIRLSNTDGTAALFTVQQIYSNTLITVSPNTSFNITSNTYQRYFTDGSILNIQDANLSLNPGSNSVTISSGYTLDSGGNQPVYIQYPVFRTPAKQISKSINRNVPIKINCANNINGANGPWSLGLTNISSLNSVYINSGNTYSNTTADLSSWFQLNDGQKDDYYDVGSISILPQYRNNITSNSTFTIYVDYFDNSFNGGIGYASVDSYPTSNDGISSNSSTISITEIPIYKSVTSANTYDLRNSIDFRPYKNNTLTVVSNTDPANTSIVINPSFANLTTFNVPSQGQYLPEIDSVFISDYETYLPRRDIVILSPTGTLTTTSGIPSNSPQLPLNISDGSVIAETYVPPFPSLTMNEASDSNRVDLSTKIILKTNKRYTMQDIGVLEKRISNLEYYTTLNFLEKQAMDTSIPDATGIDRFKNGVFADPFNDHSLGDVNNVEYKISIEPAKSLARPNFINHAVDFQYNSTLSNNIVQNGPYISLPFGHEQFAQQNYATKYRVCTESYWKWSGQATLSPSQDTFVDETTLPAINNTIDNTSTFKQLQALGAINTKIYGSQSSVSSTAVNTTQNFNQITTDVTTTTTTTQNITSLDISGSTSSTYNLGTYVTDVSLIPYIRNQDIAFYARNLRPNSQLHVFFDGVNVDQYVTPGNLAVPVEDFNYSSQPKNIVTPTGSKGISNTNPLIANSTGGISGILTIPASTFRTGDKKFLITNVDNLINGNNAIICSADAIFSASGLAVTKQSSTLTTINPEIVTRQYTDVNTVVTTNSTVTYIPDDPPVSAPFIPMERTGDGGGGGDGGGEDPIAQVFPIVSPSAIIQGFFLSKIDLFFQNKDNTKGVSVFLCETTNGSPDMSKILGKSHLESSEVNISSNGQTATTFIFDHPIYVSDSKNYSFVVEPDALSPDYTIWTAEIGGFDVFSNIQVYSSPFDGNMFLSSDNRTWTAIQTERIKFVLYRAVFNQSSGTLIINNEDDDYFTLENVAKANTRNIEIGDIIVSANSSQIANTSNNAPRGIVQFYDEVSGQLTIDSSSGNFTSSISNNLIQIHRINPPLSNNSLTSGNTASSNNLTSTIIAYGNIQSIDNKLYHAVTPKVSTLIPQGTTLNIGLLGTSNAYISDTNYTSIINENINELKDYERIVASKSNEISSLSGNKSTFMKFDLSSQNSYLSPIIDLRRKSSYFIENLINNDTTNETFNYGNAESKYISKMIQLADGQDAEDLKVYLTAYRPINSDIAVYSKFLGESDTELFNDKRWTKLNYDNGNDLVYSSNQKDNDFIEYTFSVPSAQNITQSFNANTSVNSSSEQISFVNNQFSNNQLVLYYTSVGNTAISGLSNNTFYYVTNATSSLLSLSSSQNGSPINLTASSTNEIGHFLKGYTANNNTAFLNNDNNGIIEYYNNSSSRITTFKNFAIKIVLLSTDKTNVPKLDDVRAIALQK